MRKTMIIPTYWCRKTGDPWQEGDAVYDHPTPVDQEGTLERTLVSMKQFHEKDFKLVILICPTTPEVEAAAYEQVLRIVGRAQLNAETYLFTAGDLREITEILRKAGLNDRGVQLLSMFGYSNVRNICLLAASILTADAALLIDDDRIGIETDMLQLVDHFFHVVRMGMADRDDGMSAVHIEITGSLVVPHVRALGPDDIDIPQRVNFEQIHN